MCVLGLALALWYSRKVSSPDANLRMLAKDKIALTGLFALYLLIIAEFLWLSQGTAP